MHSARLKKWLVRAAKVTVVILVVWFVRQSLAAAWQQWHEHAWEKLGWGWIAFSCAAYLLALFPAGVFWHRALLGLGQDAGFGETIRAYYIGHLGKYVPGKAMVVILRAGMVGSHRVHIGVAAAGVFLETLTWLAVGSFLAAAFLAVSLRGEDLYFVVSLGLMAATGLPTLPPVFKLLARIAGIGKSDPETLANVRRMNYRLLLIGWALMTCGWVIMGLAYWSTLGALGVPGLGFWESLPRCTASVALATVAGFMVVFLPGGVGVREAALVTLVVPYLRGVNVADPELVAWASAVVMRLVSLVSEVAISVILYVGGLRWRRAAPPPSSL